MIRLVDRPGERGEDSDSCEPFADPGAGRRSRTIAEEPVDAAREV